MEAFLFAEGEDATTQNLKNAVLAKQLAVLSEILTKSFDGTKMIPFSLLDKQKKRTISFLIADEISSMQKFHDSYSSSMLTLNKAAKAKKRQNILDGLLRVSYPSISEGRGFANALGPVKLSMKLLSPEVNISPENQYFCTPPKMALHGNPGTPLSMDSIISARSPKKAIFLHIIVIFLHGLPHKVFCAQLKQDLTKSAMYNIILLSLP